MKHPNILLAGGNVGKVVRNVSPFLSKESQKQIEAELEKNIRGLYNLGCYHFDFAQKAPKKHWRQITSRNYYAAYNVVRSIRLKFEGIYSTDSSDHKKIENLPAKFPNVNTYKNRLKILREDRKLADYDHSAVESELLIAVADQKLLVATLLTDAKVFLHTLGVTL